MEELLEKLYRPEDNHDDPPQTWARLKLEGAPEDCQVIEVDSKTYLFGRKPGCTEQSLFWSGNLKTNTFSRIVAQNCPAPRQAFVMTAGIDSRTIVLAGGILNKRLSRDFWVYSIHKRSWKLLVPPDSPASEIFAFYGQSMCLHNSVYLLFGGCDGCKYSNSLFRFDPFTLRTEQLRPTGNAPSPRYMHRSLILSDKMYVFGGGNQTTCGKSIDVYCLDLNTLQWSSVCSNGNIPCARAAHSCSYDDVSQQVFVFGGFSHKVHRLNDLYAFDPRSSTWKTIHSNGTCVPLPRAFHSSLVHGGCLYTFGGNNADKKQSALEVNKFQIRAQPLSLVALTSKLLLAMESSCL